MSNPEGSWDDGFEASWKAFRTALTRKLERLEQTEVLCLDVLVGDDDVESAAAPYVLMTPSVDQAWVRGEVSGNAFLPDAHRMDAAQESLLTEIGWRAPSLELDEPGQVVDINFAVEVGTDDLEWLAVMAVRALREVFGVVHPSFVRAAGLGPDDGAVEDEAELSHPTTRDELVDLVDLALTPVFGHAPTRDEDGDIPVVAGQSVVFVQVHPAAPVVDLYAEVVLDLVETSRALVEMNILNTKPNGLVYSVCGDRIIARHRVSAVPFVPELLRDALGAALGTVDEVAGDLVARLGGRKFGADREPVKPLEPVTRPTRPACRVWIETLTHLEDDQPGSVSAVLAAHIFHRDQRAILREITRQRRLGRLDLVATLRGALRIVVEEAALKGADR
ncbi:MAG: hypothetical protein ABI873_19495 [Marmoricola sp.]